MLEAELELRKLELRIDARSPTERRWQEAREAYLASVLPPLRERLKSLQEVVDWDRRTGQG